MGGFLLYSLALPILLNPEMILTSTLAIQSSKASKHIKTHIMLKVDNNLVIFFFFLPNLTFTEERETPKSKPQIVFLLFHSASKQVTQKPP